MRRPIAFMLHERGIFGTKGKLIDAFQKPEDCLNFLNNYRRGTYWAPGRERLYLMHRYGLIREIRTTMELVDLAKAYADPETQFGPAS